jgi:phosphoglycolate phosphatase
MKLELDRLFPVALRRELRCLHIAPEYGLSHAIRHTFADYVPADIDTERYSHIQGVRRIDLCDHSSIREFGKFDVVLHAHVIEHVPCNYTIALLHLHRALQSGGRQLFSVPIYGRSFEESLDDLSGSEREKRFGQFDHMRRFSPFDIRRTIGAIFRIPECPEIGGHYSVEFLEGHNIPKQVTERYTGDHCFSPAAGDCLI